MGTRHNGWSTLDRPWSLQEQNPLRPLVTYTVALWRLLGKGHLALTVFSAVTAGHASLLSLVYLMQQQEGEPQWCHCEWPHYEWPHCEGENSLGWGGSRGWGTYFARWFMSSCSICRFFSGSRWTRLWISETRVSWFSSSEREVRG